MFAPYRLFSRLSDWQSLRDKLQDPFFQKLYEGNQKALDALLNLEVHHTPINLQECDGTVTNLTWRGHKNRILRGALGWWLDQNEKAADLIRRTVDAMLAEEWGPFYSNCQLRFGGLRTGDIAFCCAFVCDVVPEVLGKERLNVILQRIQEDLIPRYFNGIKGGDWWARAPFNWGPAMHANMGLIGLLVEEQLPELASSIQKEVKKGLGLTIDYFPEGGGWTEGPMYLQTTIGHLTDYIAALWRVHGDDMGLSEHTSFLKTLDYRMLALAPDGGHFNFSNCNERTPETGSPQAYFWAEHCQRPDWTHFEDLQPRPWYDSHGAFYDIEAFWYRPAHPQKAEPQLPSHHHCKGLDWVHYRGKRSWLALRAGFNGANHNQNDLGQIIVGHDQTRWLCDPGYGASKTSQHNCATFAKDQCHCATAPILRQRCDENYYYACIDISQAYPFHLSSYHRHLLLLDDEHLLILDQADGRNDRRCNAGFHLQTRAQVTVEEKGLVKLQKDQKTAFLQRLSSIEVSPVNVLAWEHAEMALSSLSWNEVCDRRKVVHLQVLSFSSNPPHCTMEQNGQTVHVAMGDRKVNFHLDTCDVEVDL